MDGLTTSAAEWAAVVSAGLGFYLVLLMVGLSGKAPYTDRMRQHTKRLAWPQGCCRQHRSSSWRG